MSWIAISIAGAGALSATGTIVGGALAQPDLGGGPDVLTNRINPLLSPLTALIVAESLATGSGIVDPNFLLNAGPIGQIQSDAISSGTAKPEFIGGGMQQIRQAYERWKETGEIRDISTELYADQAANALLFGSSPFNNLEDLFRAQQNYEMVTVGPLIERLQKAAASGTERSALVDDAVLDLTRQAVAGTDLEGIREAERARLDREIGQSRTEALRRGNAGGFNPAAELEALQDTETDADLIALQRALGLVTGQQTVQRNALDLLNAFDPFYQVLGVSNSIRPPSATPSVYYGPPTSNAALGSGIANAGLILGNTALSLAPGEKAPGASDNSFISALYSQQP